MTTRILLILASSCKVSNIKKTFVILIILIAFNNFGNSQVSDSTKTNYSLSPGEKADNTIVKHYVDLGTGVGLDYGGVIGIKTIILPIPNFGIFGIIGVNFVGLAWNIGGVWNILPSTSRYHFRPNIKLMYGINGTTRVLVSTLDATWVNYDKSFKGFTPGIGLEMMLGKSKRNGFDLDLSVPIHGKDYYDQIESIKNDPHVDDYVTSWPVTISLGYHHEF